MYCSVQTSFSALRYNASTNKGGKQLTAAEQGIA